MPAATAERETAPRVGLAIDPEGSEVRFSTRQMAGLISGRFRRVSGEIEYDRAHPERSFVDARIEAASISTGIAALDQHLLSPDLLDAAEFPEIVFRSERIERTDDTYRIHGQLLIWDERRPVVVEARVEAAGASDGLGFVGRTAVQGLFANEELKIEILLTARPARPVDATYREAR